MRKYRRCEDLEKPWEFWTERCLYGYRIWAAVTLLNADIHVLLTGGSLPHTGAVSMYFDGKEEGNIQPEGHKDQVISESWSRRLSEEFHCRVTVVCGIHYDHLARDEIMQIISATGEMLEEIISEIRKQRLKSEDNI